MNKKQATGLSVIGALALVALLLAVTTARAEQEVSPAGAPAAPAAPVSSTISYQGRLLDSSGDPVDGAQTMAFRVYTQPVAGAPLWSQTRGVDVDEGFFTVHLDVDPALFDGQALWLGVQVTGDVQELAPRQPLLPVPYAFHALTTRWAGLMDVPPGLHDGDDDTTYVPGPGLALTGNAFEISTTYRLPQGCGGDQVAKWDAVGDSWYCTADDDTTYIPGLGLILTDDAFEISTTYRLPQSCSGGQIAEWDGSAWQCGDDDTGAGGGFWSLTGNAGTTPGTHFLGTTDGVSLTLAVSSTAALRLEPNGTSPNLIGGHPDNYVAPGVYGATIGGGGGVRGPNRVTDDYGTVGGGAGNRAGDDAGNTTSATDATVGGGHINTATANQATVGGGGNNHANGRDSTVGGGEDNYATAIASTIGGGTDNYATGQYATIGGGRTNTASGQYAAVSGGSHNTASGHGATVGGGITNTATLTGTTIGGGESNAISATHGTIGGGRGNLVTATYGTIAGGYYGTVTGDYAIVGGGVDNSASGVEATIGGGGSNTADGDLATIGGGTWNTANGAVATITGGDSNVADGDYAAIGGGGSNSASGQYATVPGGANNLAGGDYSFAAGTQAQAIHTGAFVWSSNLATASERSNQFRVRAEGGVRFDVNNGDWINTWNDGTNVISTSTGARLTTGGVWANASDRDLKENFATVDGQEVLARLAEVPITTWNYKAEDSSVWHMGPTAQDFYAAFGLGGSETSISTVDADGVALAAIQGLYERSQEQAARIEGLEAENAALRRQVSGLEARLATLEATAGSTAPTWSLRDGLLPGVSLLLAGLSVAIVLWKRERR